MFEKAYEFTARTNSTFKNFTDFAEETHRQIDNILHDIQNGKISTTDSVDIRVIAETQEKGNCNYRSAIVIVYNYDAHKRVSHSDAETIRTELFKNTMWYSPENNSDIRKSGNT